MGLSILLFLLLLYFAAMTAFVLGWLLHDTAPRMLAHNQNKLRGTGVTFSEKQEKECYTINHTVEDGIERIIYTPKERRHETPILMAHGMWHGAWCWRPWQEFLAEHGWESVAYSLPGHGKSPLQRSLTTCTLGYYLAFVRDEINRLPQKPVLMGHSMGGALSQWVLRYVCTANELPAVVLVAPWVSHSVLTDAFFEILALDPAGMGMMFLTWNSTCWMRNPTAAASKLISKDAMFSPEELHRQVGGESGLVIFQHNPPFWEAAENVKIPILLLAGEKDAVVTVEGLRKSAAHYKADFQVIPGSAHNLMMEKTYLQTAERIDGWLNEKQIA